MKGELVVDVMKLLMEVYLVLDVLRVINVFKDLQELHLH